MKFLSKFLCAIAVLFVVNLPIFAIDFDVSVDEEIKKKYNTNKIEYDLPPLPKVQSTTSVNTQKPSVATSVTKVSAPTNVVQLNKTNGYKIKAWSKFLVVSSQTISDNLKSGANLTFTLQQDWYGKYVKLPKGTKLYGKVQRSHKPQYTGNGGSIVFKIVAVSYNGKTYQMDAKVTKANNKNIFLNNIKGERRYLKGVKKQVEKGEAFYNKTSKTATKLSSNPILFIISPIPKVVGFAGYGVCTLLSPITAVSTKGDNLSIPSGKVFEIKLLEPSYVK